MYFEGVFKGQKFQYNLWPLYKCYQFSKKKKLGENKLLAWYHFLCFLNIPHRRHKRHIPCIKKKIQYFPHINTVPQKGS